MSSEKKSIVDSWQLEDAKFDRLEKELIDKGVITADGQCPIEQLFASTYKGMKRIPNLVQAKSGAWVEPDVLAQTEPEEYKRITEDMVKRSRFYTQPKGPSDDWDNGQD